MEITIRPINKKDNSRVAEMIREVFREHHAEQTGTVYSDPTTDNLFELFKRPASILLVAEKDGKILGCCGIFPTEGLPKACAEMVKFYLSAEARGKGIGKELMQRSIQSAREFGYKQLYLESLPEFGKAVGMYERAGFKRLKNPLGNSGHYSCNIWMLKEL